MFSVAAILGAVARGWCHPKNSSKVMDVDLAEAISHEVSKVVNGNRHEDWLKNLADPQKHDDDNGEQRFTLLSGKIAKATEHSGWYDIFSSADALIGPNLITMVPTGIVTKFSPNLRARISEKSGRALAGLRCHGGCIDADYDGEWFVMMSFCMPDSKCFEYCGTKQRSYVDQILKDGHFIIPAGTAVAQFKLEYIPDVTIVTSGDATFLDTGYQRTGGFGSTEEKVKKAMGI